MILLKMGGSIITNKQRPLSPRRLVIDKISKSLRQIKEPLVVVHGGGSFGHYWSVKYDMHTKPARYESRGVSVVKNSMVQLNKIILDSLLKNNVNSYCLPPTDFMAGTQPIKSKIREIGQISKSQLVPVTFGDVLWAGQKKTYILSGDQIMTILARQLKPKVCIFALNVDGVYSDFDSKELITEIKPQDRPTIARNGMDVTGGMKRKIEESTKIAKMGINVFLVNGNKPQRIINAIKRRKFEGTVFRGKTR